MKNLAFSFWAAARLFPVGARRDSLRVAGVIDATQADSNADRRRDGHVPQPARQHDRHAPRAGAVGEADRLEAVRRSVRRPLRREGAPWVTHPTDGRAASAQARTWRLG